MSGRRRNTRTSTKRQPVRRKSPKDPTKIIIDGKVIDENTIEEEILPMVPESNDMESIDDTTSNILEEKIFGSSQPETEESKNELKQRLEEEEEERRRIEQLEEEDKERRRLEELEAERIRREELKREQERQEREQEEQDRLRREEEEERDRQEREEQLRLERERDELEERKREEKEKKKAQEQKKKEQARIEQEEKAAREKEEKARKMREKKLEQERLQLEQEREKIRKEKLQWEKEKQERLEEEKRRLELELKREQELEKERALEIERAEQEERERAAKVLEVEKKLKKEKEKTGKKRQEIENTIRKEKEKKKKEKEDLTKKDKVRKLKKQLEELRAARRPKIRIPYADENRFQSRPRSTRPPPLQPRSNTFINRNDMRKRIREGIKIKRPSNSQPKPPPVKEEEKDELKIPDFDNMTEDEKTKYRTKLHLMMQELKNNWSKRFEIPGYSSEDLRTQFLEYHSTCNELMMMVSNYQYKNLLIIIWIGLEFAATRWFKFEFLGSFVEAQMNNLFIYDHITSSMGRMGGIGINNKWPPYLQALTLTVINLAVFIIMGFIAKYLGAGTLGVVTNLLNGALVSNPVEKSSDDVEEPPKPPSTLIEQVGANINSAAKFFGGNNNAQQPAQPQQQRRRRGPRYAS